MGSDDMDYRERLLVPWYAWLICLLAGTGVATVSIAVLPPRGVLVVLGLSTAATALLAWRWSPVVAVSDGELRAGRARIGLSHLGPSVPLDAAAAQLLRGRDIDPAAYHLMRSWVPTAVKVVVSDPADPTPYWYVSTRHPDRLVLALQRR